MNNEEKAKEIAGYKPDEKPEIPMFQGQDGDKYACYESAMVMAQWKDEQLTKCLERLKEEYLQSGSFDVDEFKAKLATLQRIEEEMKISKI